MKYDFSIAEKAWKEITDKGMKGVDLAKKYGIGQRTLNHWITKFLAERSGKIYKFKKYKPK
jgi:uncharacterized protein YjcR